MVHFWIQAQHIQAFVSITSGSLFDKDDQVPTHSDMIQFYLIGTHVLF